MLQVKVIMWKTSLTIGDAAVLPFIWDMRYLKVILNGSTMKSQCPKKAKQCIATTWRPASGKVISECNTTPRQNAVFFSRYGVLLIHKTPKRFRMTKKLNCYAKAKMYTSESLATKAQADKVIWSIPGKPVIHINFWCKSDRTGMEIRPTLPISMQQMRKNGN